MNEIKLLDTIAILEDLPEENLKRGEVGTVVELLAPDVFEVEFADRKGRAYLILPVKREQLLVLFKRQAA